MDTSGWLPLKVGEFTLNLNKYRNAHYRTLNNAKKDFMWQAVVLLPKGVKGRYMGKQVAITYTLYQPTKRLCDVANICSVVDKFFCDALTAYGVWDDDNTDTLKSVTYVWGGVDKEHPRCEFVIKELENGST